MTPMTGYQARIDNADAASPLVLVCEHASNAFPANWGSLGLSPAVRQAHVAWDPGALDLARGLAQRLGAALVHAPVSRLVYDLNRPPHSPGAMPERSEIFEIPGNMGLAAAARAERVAQVYLPFHDSLSALLAGRLAAGQVPVVVTVHSFTPVYHGQPRQVEFGIIHDTTLPGDDRLARAILAEAEAQTDLVSQLNAPYCAADGVTHLLRRQAVPLGLPHAMLELRNDLIDRPETAEAMAARLAPVLAAALARLEGESDFGAGAGGRVEAGGRAAPAGEAR